MAIQKLLIKNTTTGATEQYTPIASSAGAADEGKIPALNASGLIDSSMLAAVPSTNTLTAALSEIVAAGEFVNINNSTGTPLIQLANATDGTKPANGYLIVGGTATESVTAYLDGQNALIPVSGFANTDIGKRVFLSASAGGGATLTPPVAAGNYMQCLGTLIAVDATYATVAFEFDDGVIM